MHAYTMAIFLNLAYFKTSGRTTAKLMSDAVSWLQRPDDNGEIDTIQALLTPSSKANLYALTVNIVATQSGRIYKPMVLWYWSEVWGEARQMRKTHDNILLQVRYQWKYFDGSNEFLGGSEKPSGNLLLEIHSPDSKVGNQSTKTSQSNAGPQISRPKATQKFAGPTNLKVQRSVKSRKSVPLTQYS